MAGVLEYNNKNRLEWDWQAIDGAMAKAPLGGAGTGANPTDRGKKGTKRNILGSVAKIIFLPFWAIIIAFLSLLACL